MNKLFKKIVNLTCLLYVVSSFILNFLPWLFSKKGNSTMLTIWANLIIFITCFIFASAFMCKHKNKKECSKLKLFNLIGGIYSIAFFCLNIIQYIIKKENFWNGYTLLILILFGFVCSILITKVKINNYLVSAIFNYIILGIFHYIFFVIKAGFTKGTYLLISIGIYTLIYVSSAIVYYIFIAKNHKKQNSNKTYKNLFS